MENLQKTVCVITDCDVLIPNGMTNRLLQLIFWLNINKYKITILSLTNSNSEIDFWAKKNCQDIIALNNFRVFCVRLAYKFWYLYNTLLVCKLGFFTNFRLVNFGKLVGLDRFIEKYDVLVSTYIWPAYLVGAIGNNKTTIDLTDVMANRHERIKQRRWITLSSKDEEFIVNSSKSIAISDYDAHIFKELYNIEVPVCPFYPAASLEINLNFTNRNSITLGFLSANGSHNERVIDILLSQKVQQILNDLDLKLIIAGGISHYAHMKAIDPLDNKTTIFGKVTRLTDFYENVDIVINPVGPSTGIKVKSVEALFFDKILITTKYGVDNSFGKYFKNDICLIKSLADEDFKEALFSAINLFKSNRSLTSRAHYISKCNEAMAKHFIQ